MTIKKSCIVVRYVHKLVSNHSWDKSDLDSIKTFDVRIDLEKILHATLLDPTSALAAQSAFSQP